MATARSAYDQQAKSARAAVATALRHGTIERAPCVECGAPAEAHHHLGYDPEHWLDVEWLCRGHHHRRHFLSTQSWAAIKAGRDQVSLAGVRHYRGVTQADLAERLGINQSNISAMESRSDMAVSTLRSYAEALGGRLVLSIAFEDETRTIKIG